MRFFIDVDPSLTPANHHVCLLGNVPELGAWSPRQAVVMHRTDKATATWSAHVDLPTSTPIEYKYAIASTRDHTFVVWESFPTNRTLETAMLNSTDAKPYRGNEVHDGWFGLDMRELGDCSKLHVETRYLEEPETRLVLGSLVGRASITLFESPATRVHVAVRVPGPEPRTLWPQATSFHNAVDTSVPLHAWHAKLLGNASHRYSLPQATALAVDASSLKQIALLETLQDDVLADVATAFDTVSFHAGQDLVALGQPRRYFYWIQSGTVQVCGQATTEGQHVYLELATGSFFGELALVGGAARSSHIRVPQDSAAVTCRRLDRAAFLTILAKHNIAKHSVVRSYVHQLVAQHGHLAGKLQLPGSTRRVPLEQDSLQVFTIRGDPAYVHVDVFSHDTNELIGTCTLTRSQLALNPVQTQGIVASSIVSGQGVRGEGVFEYLHVRPHVHPANAVHTSKPQGLPAPSAAALDIGHRGLGRSYYQKLGHRVSWIRENTLPSFIVAGFSGADMIEFDVQLSKDRVPVVYHDFFFNAKLGHRVASATLMSKMGLHDLTLAQLNKIEWRHCVQTAPSRFRSLVRKHWHTLLGRPAVAPAAKPPKVIGTGAAAKSSDVPPSMQTLCDLFPTLRLALDHVPIYVGFNIEIKYPMEHQNRHLCALPAFELNAYVDAILDVVLEFGRSRHIVFSCFAPDVCVLLRAKQSKHQVFFLTCGVDIEEEVWDKRCIALDHAVAFSQMEGLHGIVTNSDPLLEAPHLIPAIKNNTQLSVFTWGDQNTSHPHVQRQKKHGVDGVISDNIGDLTLRDRKRRPRDAAEAVAAAVILAQ